MVRGIANDRFECNDILAGVLVYLSSVQFHLLHVQVGLNEDSRGLLPFIFVGVAQSHLLHAWVMINKELLAIFNKMRLSVSVLIRNSLVQVGETLFETEQFLYVLRYFN